MKKLIFIFTLLFCVFVSEAQTYKGYVMEAYERLQAKKAFIIDNDTLRHTTQVSFDDDTIATRMFLRFDNLLDVPRTKVGQAGKVVMVNETEDSLIYSDGIPKGTKIVEQVSHGLIEGNWIRLDKYTGLYTKARADTTFNADVIGIVDNVYSVDSFSYQYSGVYKKGDWTPGTNYYLDPDTEGEQTEIDAFTAGEVRVYLGTGLSTTELLLEIDVGVLIVEENQTDAQDLIVTKFDTDSIFIEITGGNEVWLNINDADSVVGNESNISATFDNSTNIFSIVDSVGTVSDTIVMDTSDIDGLLEFVTNNAVTSPTDTTGLYHSNRTILDGIDQTDIDNWDEDLVDDADADPTNELQDTTNITGLLEFVINHAPVTDTTGLYHSNRTVIDGITETDINNWDNDLVDDADNDPTNELQDTTNFPGLQEFIENHSINEESLYIGDSANYIQWNDTTNNTIVTDSYLQSTINGIGLGLMPAQILPCNDTITHDYLDGNNVIIELCGNINLYNFENVPDGGFGSIVLIQDEVGGFVVDSFYHENLYIYFEMQDTVQIINNGGSDSYANDSAAIADTLYAHNLRLLDLENTPLGTVDTTGLYHINRVVLDSISQEDIDAWNTDLVDDADNDPTNELQDTTNINGLLEFVINNAPITDTTGLYHINRELLDAITTNDTVRWGIDTDTQLSEAQVDAYVFNNEYLDSTMYENEKQVILDTLTEHNLRLIDLEDNIVVTEEDTTRWGIDTQLSEAQVDAFVANNEYLDSTMYENEKAVILDTLSAHNTRINEIANRDTTGIYHANRDILDAIDSGDITNWNNDLVDDADADPTNEIQDTTEIAGLQEFVESYSINEETLYITDSSKVLQWADTLNTTKGVATIYDLNGYVPKVSSTDNAISRFNGTTGQIQNSDVTIDDNGTVSTYGGFIALGYQAAVSTFGDPNPNSVNAMFSNNLKYTYGVGYRVVTGTTASSISSSSLKPIEVTRYVSGTPYTQTIMFSISGSTGVSKFSSLAGSGNRLVFASNTGELYATKVDSSYWWNQAYLWGDHSTFGYLTSYVETDSTVSDLVKSITETDTIRWGKYAADSINILNWADTLNTTKGVATAYDLESKQDVLTNPVTGTGTTNYVSKWIGTTTQGNSQIFDNGTNVGFGTNSPNTKLSLSSNSEIGWKYTNDASSTYHRITAGGINPISFTVNSFSANNPIYSFNGYSGNVITVLNGGNTGIGVLIPVEKLDVNGNVKATTAKLTGLTDNFIPYHVSDATGLIDAPIKVSSGIVQYDEEKSFTNPLDLISKKYSDIQDSLLLDSISGIVNIGMTYSESIVLEQSDTILIDFENGNNYTLQLTDTVLLLQFSNIPDGGFGSIVVEQNGFGGFEILNFMDASDSIEVIIENPEVTFVNNKEAINDTTVFNAIHTKLGTVNFDSSTTQVISIENLKSGMQGTIYMTIGNTVPTTIQIKGYTDNGESELSNIVLGSALSATTNKVTAINYSCINDIIYLTYNQQQ